MTNGPLIETEALSILIDQGETAVLDCSFVLADPAAGKAQFLSSAIPSAQYLDLEADLSGVATGTNGRHPLPDPARLAAALRRGGLRRGQQVIAYDRTDGAFAARLWWLLRWMGHDRVAVLNGGYARWLAEGRAVAPGRVDGDHESGDFQAAPVRSDWTVDADAVRANIDDKGFVVLDARSAERYAGTVAAFDPVPGHIPGARSRPYADNLGSDGRFKPAAQLAEELNRSTGGAAPGQVVLQCGSGVTACHNALALEIADMAGARLYPGSWSEWTSDPTRPVALGS